MLETVNFLEYFFKDNPKLSKQQKEIIKYLHHKKEWYCKLKEISWYIAEKFDTSDNHYKNSDRIYQYDYDQHKRHLIEKQNVIKQMKDKEKATKYSQIFYLESFFLAHNSGKIHESSLTNRHKASFYRSIKRLEERRIIYCFDNWHINQDKFIENNKLNIDLLKYQTSYNPYIMFNPDYIQNKGYLFTKKEFF